MCPICTYDDDTRVVEQLEGGAVTAECTACRFIFKYGGPREQKAPHVMSEVEARGRFPKVDDVAPEAHSRAERLKAQFLSEVRTEPDPRTAPFWEKYQRVFSADGLRSCDAQDLKDFANSHVGVYVGFMTGFNTAWNMDPDLGARQTRAVIDHLLRGDGSLEVRLTDLIRGDFGLSMPGFKEALLSKVLSVVYPERFLTIVTYDQKAEMARRVYGLELPPSDRVSWTIGRLAVWSNDLLNDLTGAGFANRPHAGEFLWWAKDQT